FPLQLRQSVLERLAVRERHRGPTLPRSPRPYNTGVEGENSPSGRSSHANDHRFRLVALKTAQVENHSRLEPVTHLIEPESFQTTEADVHGLEVLGAHVANGLDRFEMALEQLHDHVADLVALLRQADMHRAAIDIRTLMIDVAGLDQLLQIVRD